MKPFRKPTLLRLYQTIKFNRPIDKEGDSISPGSYTMVFRDGEQKKTIQFDFYDCEWGVDEKDPTCINCLQKNLDLVTFPEAENITEDMLRNVEEIVDWYISIESRGSADHSSNLVPVSVIDCGFEVRNDDKWEDIEIPKTLCDSIAKVIHCD